MSADKNFSVPCQSRVIDRVTPLWIQSDIILHARRPQGIQHTTSPFLAHGTNAVLQILDVEAEEKVAAPSNWIALHGGTYAEDSLRICLTIFDARSSLALLGLVSQVQVRLISKVAFFAQFVAAVLVPVFQVVGIDVINVLQLFYHLFKGPVLSNGH